MSYYYAQIDSNSVVMAVSDLSGVIDTSHPMYDSMIPLREYNTGLLASQTDDQIVKHKYTERDSDGYGVFETVYEKLPEQLPTDDEITQANLYTETLYNNCLMEINQTIQEVNDK